jgi:aldose 1-epimerase
MATTVTQKLFGTMPDGTQVPLYTLQSNALEVTLTGYGARLVTVLAPDRDGERVDIITGFTGLAPYLTDETYAGAAIGRFSNRIAQGKFSLDGVVYSLPRNNGENTLHGGPEGFDTKLWQTRIVPDGVECTLVSRDGAMGFPGTLTARITYTLVENALRIQYEAETDKPTVVNFTNHSFFNLRGEGSGAILDHVVQIHAEAFTPVDESLIPTGELASVAGTPFDFREPHTVGERIEAEHPQLKLGRGYDHNYVLGAPGTMRHAASVTEPVSGRVVTVETDSPGLQFYTGNFLDGTHIGKSGAAYEFRGGLCFETQEYPDAPNHANFPSTRLNPGERYERTTVFTFSAQA